MYLSKIKTEQGSALGKVTNSKIPRELLDMVFQPIYWVMCYKRCVANICKVHIELKRATLGLQFGGKEIWVAVG